MDRQRVAWIVALATATVAARLVMGFWETVIAGALAGLLVVIVLGLWGRRKDAPAFVHGFWTWVGARLSWLPFRVVSTDTLRRLMPPDERYRPPQLPPDSDARPYPMSLKERVEKLLTETKDAMGKYDAMTAGERHELNAYFQPYVMQLLDLAPELRRAGHMPSFEVSRLIQADWDYLQTPTRGDVDVIAKFLSDLNWGTPAVSPKVLPPIVVREYIGGTDFYVGIPARDLTEEDYAALSVEDRNLVNNGKLYSRPQGKG